MGKKSAATSVSKISSTSAPAATSTTSSSDKSSILKSSFAPSRFQLHLFASVIQSFESQELRLHDTNTGRLRQQHATRPGTTITSLDWGHYSSAGREHGQNGNTKKRKRAHVAEDVVVAFGTSTSDICMFSPAEGRVVGTLSGAHERGVRDFRFSTESPSQGWSIGGDKRLVQWDLSTNQALKSIPLQDSAINMLSSPSVREPQLLCASNTPYSIFPSEDFRIAAFDSFKGQVHSMVRSGGTDTATSEYLIAADTDRYINIFNLNTQKLVRTLVTGSEVEQLDLFSSPSSESVQHEHLLAAVTRDGVVELFSHPFKLPSVINGDSKSKQRNKTRKADATVKMVAPTKGSVRIFRASIQGADLVVVSVDSGVEPSFQKVRWQDEGSGELLFDGIKEVSKVKSSSTLNSAQINGVKDMGQTHIDESQTVVVRGTDDISSQNAVIDISSEDEEDEDKEEEDDDEKNVGLIKEDAGEEEDEDSASGSDAEVEPSASNALVSTEMQEDQEMEDAEDQSPTFGDLVASRHPTTIAIADSFAPEKSTLDTNKQLALPSGMSLGTVLTQALRTNDTNLLESCLHANDAGIIQNTIQRLDSILAANLLSKLAERLASRPGRYGHLLSWVQWTCITHGGAIAGQPDVVAKIKTLYKVLTQRSQSLDKLLLLKGKLDMLDAQLTLRKQIQAQRRTHGQDQGEPGMIYMEGEEDNWSSDEDVDETVGVSKKSRGKQGARRALEDLVGDVTSAEDEDLDDEEMPTTNGIAGDSDDEESDEEEEVTGRTRGGMYDVEAEVSGEEDSEEDDDEEGSDLNSGDEDGEEIDEQEDDSSMESFINDGEISMASDEGGINLDDDEDEEPEIRKPEKKKQKSKHR